MTLGDRIVVMKDGVIQQVDSPLKIYNFPANRFVAGFIGSPAMNFVSGSIAEGIFTAEQVEYPLRDTAHEGDAILGFRPEHLVSDPSQPKLAEVTLEVVERMGHETIVYFQLNGESMVARLGGDADASPGDKKTLHLPQAACHMFEANGDQKRI